MIQKYLIGGAVVLALAMGFYLKLQRDATLRARAEIERKNSDDINTAREARDQLRADCDRDPAKCVRDDWFRD